mgnify:CR=1 FL=1
MTKLKDSPKENILHKVILAILTSITAATAAGVLGYRLNLRTPELYYDVPTQLKSTVLGYKLTTNIYNLGNSSAYDVVIRYTFNKAIIQYDYNYSEGLNGKLSSANVEGGVSEKELILMPRRILPGDTIEASFIFAYPRVSANVKVFSKEVMGRPYSEHQEKNTKGEELARKVVKAKDDLFEQVQSITGQKDKAPTDN